MSSGRAVAARAGRRPGPKPRLRPGLIVEAAFAVTERDGAQGLTFQALGEELGTHPTAIYRHFRDRDDLMLALLDALQAEILAEAPEPTEDWAADLRALAMTTHEVFLRHPQIAQHMSARTARREHEFRKVDRVIGCMRRAGFGEAEAARAYRAFSNLVLAFSAQDAALRALPPELLEADLRAWEVEYRHLPGESYPNIAAVSGFFPDLGGPATFETVVELLLDALRARAGAAVQGAARPERSS